MAKDNSLHIDESMVDTVLAEDLNFQGTMKFTKSLMIKGKFEGQIDASGHLIIGPNAIVSATIKAGVITNYGQINGNVEGTERVELFNHARLTGDIKTPEVIIESGCNFNGTCVMSDKRPSQAPVSGQISTPAAHPQGQSQSSSGQQQQQQQQTHNR
jgi:cytoskeletal protein CcmA (bactofilin family)